MLCVFRLTLKEVQQLVGCIQHFNAPVAAAALVYLLRITQHTTWTRQVVLLLQLHYSLIRQSVATKSRRK